MRYLLSKASVAYDIGIPHSFGCLSIGLLFYWSTKEVSDDNSSVNGFGGRVVYAYYV